MNVQQILADIHALEEGLPAFERKYGIRSETFHAAYVNGEEPGHDERVLRLYLFRYRTSPLNGTRNHAENADFLLILRVNRRSSASHF